MAKKEEAIGENTIDAVTDWINDSIKLMRKGLDKGGKNGSSNNTGTLQQSLGKNFQKPVKVKGGFLNATIDAEDYWYYVDQGRKPGEPPPLRDILNWVQTKLPIPKSLDWAYAKTIQRNIAKFGTEGTGFAENALTPKRIEQLKLGVTEGSREDTIIAINGMIK